MSVPGAHYPGPMQRFLDRRSAGRELAAQLEHHDDPLVIGIIPGGVPVADEIAVLNGWDLAGVPVRTIGSPESPNLILGAVAPDEVVVLDRDLSSRLGITGQDVADQVSRAMALIRSTLAAVGVDEPEVQDREIVVVGDSATTGTTFRTVLGYVMRRGAARTCAAIPVAPPATVDLIAGAADEVVCLEQPLRMKSVGEWYQLFGPVDELDVRAILNR